MSLLLTSAAIHDLTGRAQAKRQIVWLTENAWKFSVGADGLPKVAQSYFDERMGGKPATKRRGPRLAGLAVE